MTSAIPTLVPIALSFGVVLAGSGPIQAADGAAAFDCVIEPAMTAKLGSQLPGVLRSVDVDRGDAVKAGMVVATLDANLDQRNLAIASQKARNDAELKIAGEARKVDDSRLARRVALHERQVISEEVMEKSASDAKLRELDVERARQSLELARLEAERAQTLLDMRSIRAPFDGVVTARSMAPGEMVTDERHILEVAKLDPLHINAFVPLAWFNKVKVGMNGRVTPEAAIGGAFQAVVTVKDAVSDAASGTFSIRLEVPNPDLAIASGVHCKVVLEGAN